MTACAWAMGRDNKNPCDHLSTDSMLEQSAENSILYSSLSTSYKAVTTLVVSNCAIFSISISFYDAGMKILVNCTFTEESLLYTSIKHYNDM